MLRLKEAIRESLRFLLFDNTCSYCHKRLDREGYICSKCLEKLKKDQQLTSELLNRVKYLLIKHTYQCGRESKVKEFDKKFEISERLKKIKTKEDFDLFYRYLEEIVAYVKYYIG